MNTFQLRANSPLLPLIWSRNVLLKAAAVTVEMMLKEELSQDAAIRQEF